MICCHTAIKYPELQPRTQRRRLSMGTTRFKNSHFQPSLEGFRGALLHGTRKVRHLLMFVEILPSEAAHRNPLWRVFPNVCAFG